MHTAYLDRHPACLPEPALAGRLLALGPPTSQFLRSIWKLVRPRRLELEGCYGFEDPFVTSQLHVALLAMDVRESFTNWDLQPLFDGAENRGVFRATGRCCGGALIKTVVTYVAQRPVRRELVALWS